MGHEPQAISLASVTIADGADLIAANRDSVDHHAPWVQAFLDKEAFAQWFVRAEDDSNCALIARLLPEGAVIGVVTLSQIFRHNFQSAYLSYYGTRALAGRGLMTQAVRAAIGMAFDQLGLHRLEANIQPGNTRSIALVQRLGFRQEGYSPRYLHIDGAWRDHERWALLADDWAQAEENDR